MFKRFSAWFKKVTAPPAPRYLATDQTISTVRFVLTSGATYKVSVEDAGTLSAPGYNHA